MPVEWIGRQWSRGIGWHLTLLAVILVAGAWLSTPGAAWSSDEGAVRVQVELLLDGTWAYEPPDDVLGGGSSDADAPLPPTGLVGLPRGERTETGVAPYVKQPAYPLLLLPFRLGLGAWGATIASICGTLAAAGAAAALTSEISTRGSRAALWLVGAASPLFFDAFLTFAHTLAAGLVGLMTLAALRGLRAGLGLRWAVPASAACAACAVVLRREALLVVLALAVGLVVVTWSARKEAKRARLLAVGIVLGAGSAVVVEALGRRAILGARPSGAIPAASSPGLSARWSAMVDTWLRPSIDAGAAVDAVLVVALLGVVVAGVALRTDRVDIARVALVVAAVGYAFRVLAVPPATVPGLLYACPWLVGLVLLTRRQLGGRGARILLITVLGASFAILATQYEQGGGLEWGGRYFAVVLPLAAPLVVLAASGAIERGRTDLRRDAVLVGAALVIVLSLGLLGLRDLRSKHDGATDAARALDELAALHPEVARSEVGPIVFTPGLPDAGLVLWSRFFDYAWVGPDAEATAEVSARLRDRHPGPLLGIASGDEVWEELGWRVLARHRQGGATIVLVEPGEPPPGPETPDDSDGVPLP